ncbi:MAG: hypothetical protein H6823_18965 [Planctomycetaceae bacterium]|nr:hypothetical protein [Planctomycetales bacterium]MCB9940325.1 hypothetical protein [Planctomycetaceae bacterium]
MKRTALILASTALLLSPSLLQAQVKLEHKFPDGRKTTQNKYVKVEQTLTIAGMEIPSTSEQNVTSSEMNGKRKADGTLESVHKIESLQSTIEVAGMKLKFDSVNADAPPPGTALDALIDVLKAVAGSSWTVTYGQDNSVLSVTGGEDALKNLPEALRAATAKQFSDEHLTNESNQEMRVLPDGPVKQGDSWEREETVFFDSYQSMTFTTVYKYEGTIEKDGKTLDQISSKTTTVSYAMAGESPSPLKIVDSQLKVTDSGGTLLFDRAAGMVIDRKDIKHISGSLKCEINGMELPGKLELTFEATMNRS